jgi:uncharacterized protein YbaA (DUF1428 family)
MNYVDGFVIPVPTAKLDAYRAVAERCAAVLREHGALQVIECVADDVKPGKLTSFPQSVQLQEGETVVFSWIVYSSREARDEISAKFMADARVADVFDPANMVFDGKRLIWGGFKVIVNA